MSIIVDASYHPEMTEPCFWFSQSPHYYRSRPLALSHRSWLERTSLTGIYITFRQRPAWPEIQNMNSQTWLLIWGACLDGGCVITFNVMNSKKVKHDCKNGPVCHVFLSSCPLPRNLLASPTLAPGWVMWLPLTNEVLANIKQSEACKILKPFGSSLFLLLCLHHENTLQRFCWKTGHVEGTELNYLSILVTLSYSWQQNEWDQPRPEKLPSLNHWPTDSQAKHDYCCLLCSIIVTMGNW